MASESVSKENSVNESNTALAKLKAIEAAAETEKKKLKDQIETEITAKKADLKKIQGQIDELNDALDEINGKAGGRKRGGIRERMDDDKKDAIIKSIPAKIKGSMKKKDIIAALGIKPTQFVTFEDHFKKTDRGMYAAKK